jgi:hypothetical protein
MDKIGGAYVRLGFNFGERRMKSGEALSREQILSMPIGNRRSLISSGHLECYPRAPDAGEAGAAAPAAKGDRHMVHLGRGLYDVIEGVKLNEAPLSREDATALAER